MFLGCGEEGEGWRREQREDGVWVWDKQRESQAEAHTRAAANAEPARRSSPAHLRKRPRPYE